MDKIQHAVTKAGDAAERTACPTTKVRCGWNAGVSLFLLVVLIFALVSCIVQKVSSKIILVLGCLIPLVLLFLAWNVFRYRMVDRLCHFQFSEGTPCPAYQAKWRQAFRNTKIVTTASNVQAATSGFTKSSNQLVKDGASVIDATAAVGGTVAALKLIVQDWEMNHRLYKCATGGKMSKRLFVFMRVSLFWVPICAVVGLSHYAFHARLTEALRRSQEEDEKRGDTQHQGNPATAATVVCVLIAAIIGSTIGNFLLMVQAGRWRRKIGLSFIDWPRLVL